MQIAFDFDDERVRTLAENKIEQSMDTIINDIVTDRIAPFKTDYYSRSGKTRDWSELDRMVKDHVNSIIDDHKDEIIQKAAEMLCESYKRTKAWKEKASDVIS
jgi:hypothetical protein